MKSSEIRKRFLAFFEKRGHAILPSAPLLPENDPSVLFNTAGMQPLVPYLLGETHPQGKRLANFQKCVRTVDIDDIGDNTHATFFEMMGNWSLGDYFKEEAIKWSYELLTSKEEGFGLDPQRLYVTCFEGDESAPKDEESARIWKSIFYAHGVTGERIYFMSAKSNWWAPGPNGPCGPDTEMFYDVTGELTNGMTKEEYMKADEEQRVVEIWNDVFMEYLAKDGKVVSKLEAKNVDTGSGYERVTMVLQGKTDIFSTDIFESTRNKISELSGISDFTDSKQIKALRIVMDHTRSAVMLLSDGVLPSNTDQGYVLRRLIRRAVRLADTLHMKPGSLFWVADTLCEQYKDIYENVGRLKETIKVAIDTEEKKFRNTLNAGMKKIDKVISVTYNESGLKFGDFDSDLDIKMLDPKVVFELVTTDGFPIEMVCEIAKERGYIVNMPIFNKMLEEHKEKSRAGAEQKFKGGLGDTSEMSVKYHTATHLLHQALREVLGTHVQQKGSNITPERLRFDFAHTGKMTDEEKKRVEDIVNEKIQAALPVSVVSLPFSEAEKTGALHFFGEKYGDTVTVYYIGQNLEGAYSKEFCGGPHVKNTNELGTFKIQKEEAVSQGVRRIKAVLS
ncbi:MAG: alanine--tRNA ligase [Candidatus Taylorbacteria bacterium]|nr:alanine--tRNA ligase [Candidatus Taylorbacteria bacterium]